VDRRAGRHTTEQIIIRWPSCPDCVCRFDTDWRHDCGCGCHTNIQVINNEYWTIR